MKGGVAVVAIISIFHVQVVAMGLLVSANAGHFEEMEVPEHVAQCMNTCRVRYFTCVGQCSETETDKVRFVSCVQYY